MKPSPNSGLLADSLPALLSHLKTHRQATVGKAEVPNTALWSKFRPVAVSVLKRGCKPQLSVALAGQPPWCSLSLGRAAASALLGDAAGTAEGKAGPEQGQPAGCPRRHLQSRF